MDSIVQLQPQLTQQIAQAVVEQRVSHAYLLLGENQLQTQQLGLWFAQALFCQQPAAGFPCGQCDHCRRITQRDFPDIVCLKTDKASLGVDEVRQAKLSLEQTGVEADHRLLLINSGAKLTPAAANSLLKFLEEPAGAVTTILEAPSTTTILPTILSRVQILTLTAAVDSNWQQQLQAQGYTAPDLKIIAQAHLENELGQDLTAVDFQKIRDLVQNWFQLLEEHPWTAFLEVGAKVKGSLENRQQQTIFLGLLEANFSRQIRQVADDGANLLVVRRLTESFLEARKYWQANVSLENSLEQLALQAVEIVKGSSL
ncbi:hypothetical protein HU830_02050 [Lactobacillus sp. DCY120]|uniref:DNA polymerase III subunit delta n=1 Tax=Bombilactobacillus apium TaxID=2675299 RepID=A0A850QZ51_9LACO|nr:hypothetical protein [Bombilactobacillus apium]NVY95973.1 hypothetical protein [Bombilactobacillus apium]